MQDLAYSTRDANSDLDEYFNNLQQSNVRANNRQKFLKSHLPYYSPLYKVTILLTFQKFFTATTWTTP